MKHLLISILTALLSACALPGYDRYPMGSGAPVRDARPSAQNPDRQPAPQPPPAEPEVEVIRTPEPVIVQPLPPPQEVASASQVQRPVAVQSLLDQAEDYRVRGRLDEAAASLERAQRIAPRDAEVYRALAEVRLAQGNPSQSEQTAQKALVYASGQNELQAELWMLIARARDAQGDAAGAESAQDEARRYQREGRSWWR